MTTSTMTARMGVPQPVAMSQAVYTNQNSPHQTNIGAVNQPQVSLQYVFVFKWN